MTDLPRILLAEDDPNDLELTLAALAEHNLSNEVVVTRDGEEVLQYLRREGPYAQRERGNPAVVLLDLKMPKLGGIEVLRAIREDPTTAAVPVVVLTSSNQDPDVEACYGLGVNAYVVKPVEFDKFLDAVKEVGLFWAVVNQPPPDPSDA